ncbi:MAG: hypothetical protein FWF73_03160 [Spirochaetes bacterium]|nr:hypothetical protein [Spirochaetota bacterium]
MADVYKLKHLRGTKLKVFLAAANRIIPSDKDSIGGGTLTTAAMVDLSIDKLEPALKKKLLLLFTVMEPLGIFFGGKIFSKASDKNKDRLLSWMEKNPISALRLGFFGLKSYICLGYYTREDAWKIIKYDGPIRYKQPYHDTILRGLAQNKVEIAE